MMKTNISLGFAVLSLMGMGLTIQMAEDTMNKDIDWMMEASLIDYLNPVAVTLCLFAFGISLFSMIRRRRKIKMQAIQD